MEAILRLNPLTHENREPTSKISTTRDAASMVSHALFHYLGNRYLWRWYGDRQLLYVHGIKASVRMTGRLISNISPVEPAPRTQVEHALLPTNSGLENFFKLAEIFSPMVIPPYLGQPKLGFWGCALGFNFHALIVTFPWVFFTGCVLTVSALLLLRPELANGQGIRLNIVPPPSTTKSADNKIEQTDLQFTVDHMAQMPPSYELDQDAQFDVQNFVDWYETAYRLDAAGIQKMKNSFESIKLGLASDNAAYKDFGVVLANIGVQLEALSPDERKPHLKDMRLAFDGCGTQWVDTFTDVYENIISGGKGLDWQVARHHHKIKWQVWQRYLAGHMDADEVHSRLSWVKVLGNRLGMELPAGINGEKVMLQNHMNDLPVLAQLVMLRLLNVSTRGREQRLQQYEDKWVELFMEQYTPDLLVDYWMGILNYKEDLKSEEDPEVDENNIGGDLNKSGNENKLKALIGSKIRAIAEANLPSDYDGDEDAYIALGYYDENYKVTKKGVARFLEEMRVVQG